LSPWFILVVFEKQLQRAFVFILLSVCLSWRLSCHWPDGCEILFGIFTKTVEQIKVWLKLDRSNTLHEDLCVVMIPSHCL